MAEFKLYSYYRSSASYRVRIALHLKGIPFEYYAVNIAVGGDEQLKPEYNKLNPSRQVPTLIHNEKAIGQSVAIIDYLEHIRPEPALFSRDPYMRALQIQACEIINSGLQPLHNLSTYAELRKYGFDDPKIKTWTIHFIESGMRAYEKLITPFAGRFSFGNEASAADCFLVPSYYNVMRHGVNTKDFPISARVAQQCMELPAFRAAHPDQQKDSVK